MKEGWLCPRCGTINAPFVIQCSCAKPVSNDISGCLNGNHQWECCGISTRGSTYRCRICNKTKNEDYNATYLYDAGYRKQSEVAREIFELVECAFSPALVYEGHTVKAYIAELKKKYTEGENDRA